MKKMNVEALSRAELLTLLSILEGELEAQDVFIHALRAQHRDAFVQERYGQYDLSDPFLALQRDSEAEERQNALAQNNSDITGHAVGPNPLAVLKLKRCRAQESARSEEAAYMLQMERDKLLQQLDAERATVRRLEKEQVQTVSQVEESLSQQQQLSSTLSLELQRACSQAQEEALKKLQNTLEEERRHAAHLKTKYERQLDEFDTEREQLKSQLYKEKERCKELERQVEELTERFISVENVCGLKEENVLSNTATESTSVQTDLDGTPSSTTKAASVAKTNGHHTNKGTESIKERKDPDMIVENGSGPLSPSPLHPLSHPRSPSSTASSSLSSSPVSSPVLAKRLGSPGFHQSAYQAGVNQRFQAARHKFQTQAELEQQHHSNGPLSPRDLSPTASTPLHQRTPLPNNWLATQSHKCYYRNLSSPTGPKSPSSGPLSPGIRSPLTSRSERTHPPPVPPKRPGMSPTPGSPNHSTRNLHFPELSGNCGDKSVQEGPKEPDLVLSSSS
ncbi:hypothetical protein WMY93_027349 [Mugilogobius chulae]|uniref:Cortactin-binding protein-2 N-terminal domain-containing protein n=1 Tax=Mugilogobius chulae TaxID=88201 RepID=A0AAW0MTS3_9GOBI